LRAGFYMRPSHASEESEQRTSGPTLYRYTDTSRIFAMTSYDMFSFEDFFYSSVYVFVLFLWALLRDSYK